VKPVGGAGSGVEGAVTNRDGYGAFVTVSDASLPHDLVWEISGGSNYLGQSDPTAFFGLGAGFTGTVDLVQVQWPGGVLQDFRDVAPNQLLLASEVSAVPEPAVASLTAALAALGLVGRRRRWRVTPSTAS
jgi:uncharacterized protein (TIGR03382 family)